MKRYGFTDSPAQKDDFQISRYIDGLSSFIRSCNTPMTVSVQGDWGTGKTSIMQMVRSQLEKDSNISVVWFNTWQFSQFNMADHLPLLMMNKLVNTVGDKGSELKAKGKQILSGLLDIGMKVATGGNVDGKSITDMFSGDFFDQFENLKGTFEKLVKERAKETGRVVIFVDDLDRLAPARAVELLEVLKIFLDCEQCVFVLAIDYNVVARGVKEKYGSDFGEEKGRSFFDKIIQVPFKMPVAAYDISNYVKTCFENIGITIQDDECLRTYVQLINHSIGNNPRSMKRLFNSFLLLSNIATDEVLRVDDNKLLLFAILCLQSRFEEIYNDIVRRRDVLDAEDILALKQEDNRLFKTLQMSDEEIEQFLVFAGDLCGLIDKDSQGGIDHKELSAFLNVLNFSTITATHAEASAEDEQWYYRNAHKEKCRAVRDKLISKYALPFKDYYRRNYEKKTWWVYLQDEERQPMFGFECRLDPAEQARRSRASLRIYPIGSTTTAEVVSHIGDNPISQLGIAPDVVTTGERPGICYANVLEIDTDANESELYDVVDTAFQSVVQHWM